MTFLLSEKGFYKETNKELLENKTFVIEHIWTDKLREAFQFSSRASGKRFLEKNKIKGFAWNPKEEVPIKDKYEVVRRTQYSDWSSEKSHEVLEWMVQKVVMQSRCDLKFLRGDSTESKYYDLDVATKICLHKNLTALNELKSKIKDTIIAMRSVKVLETVNDTSEE